MTAFGRPAATFLLCALWLQISPAAAQALLQNGSFEEGQDSPAGWHMREGGAWEKGEAHRGSRYVTGRSGTGAVVWESEPVALQPDQDYRLEGWLRCPEGEASLGMAVSQDDGRADRLAESARVRGVAAWRYVAVEWKVSQACKARVQLSVTGVADADDLALVEIKQSYFGNKGVEPDARGRIGFWNEEQNDSLLPGIRAGRFRSDTEVKREGNASLQLIPSGEWYAYSSLNYALPAWTDCVQLSGWSRCDDGADAQLLACWTDDTQQVLRVDAGPTVRGPSWQLLQFVAHSPPANTAAVRIVAVAKSGRVWFDDFDLLRLRPRKREVRVFVNQIGYDLIASKTAIVATNFFPIANETVVVRLVQADGTVVWTERVACAGRVYGGKPDDWGWYFWRADFTSFDQRDGAFRLAVAVDGERGESPIFFIKPGALLHRTAARAVDFFFIQRCGFEVPGWHKPCHLDDAKLPDGTHIDLTGGWHSAGDYNKLMYENGDGGVVFALLSAYRAAPDCFGGMDRDRDGVCDILDEAEWGARFVAKMQFPETGGLRNHINQGPGRDWMKWLAPDLHTDNAIGTADDPVVQAGDGNSPLVIGAWARLSALLNERGVKNDYLERAIPLWNHTSKNGTQVGPHLLLSAIELHSVTRDPIYLDAARRGADELLAQQARQGSTRGAFGTYGELAAGALAQFALAHPNDPITTKIKPALGEYIDFCVRTADNPFGLSKHTVGANEAFFPADMGTNWLLLARAWAAASAYRLIGDRRALVYATDHMDWILGKNPLDLCMFEGQGARNPPRYHHRYNMIPGHERGAVPGCVPNGMVKDMGLADRPGFDLSRTGGRAPSFRTSEPWLVHNMWYLLATSELQRATAEGYGMECEKP